MPRLRLLFGILLMGLLTRNLAAEDEAVTRGFRDLLASEWEYTLREAPTFASHLGDKRYNDRWPDVGLGAIERRHQHQKDVLQKLAAIDPAKLPPADRLNYLLFKKEIAEGVEHPEQLGWLRERHCDVAQGFLFSKPVPAEGIAALLATRQDAAA